MLVYCAYNLFLAVIPIFFYVFKQINFEEQNIEEQLKGVESINFTWTLFHDFLNLLFLKMLYTDFEGAEKNDWLSSLLLNKMWYVSLFFYVFFQGFFFKKGCL